MKSLLRLFLVIFVVSQAGQCALSEAELSARASRLGAFSKQMFSLFDQYKAGRDEEVVFRCQQQCNMVLDLPCAVTTLFSKALFKSDKPDYEPAMQKLEESRALLLQGITAEVEKFIVNFIQEYNFSCWHCGQSTWIPGREISRASTR